jgi:hypothetical protein
MDFEVRHPRCVSHKSDCKVCAYIVRHNCVLGGSYLLFVKHNYSQIAIQKFKDQDI